MATNEYGWWVPDSIQELADIFCEYRIICPTGGEMPGVHQYITGLLTKFADDYGCMSNPLTQCEQELKKANDRLVEHKQMNQSLNEVNQSLEKQLVRVKEIVYDPYITMYETVERLKSVLGGTDDVKSKLAATTARIAELEKSEKQARDMSVSARMALKEDGEMQELLDEANAKIDAQAAALERVRRACLHINTHGEEEPINGTCAAILRTLANTPEHMAPAISGAGGGSGVGASEQLAIGNARIAELECTAPDEASDDFKARLRAMDRVVALEDKLTAANARIAELEHINDVYSAGHATLAAQLTAANARVAELEETNKDLQRLLSRTVPRYEFDALNEGFVQFKTDSGKVIAANHRTLDAAIARAEAAERVMREDCAAHEKRCQLAESEAASLRAELDAKCAVICARNDETKALSAEVGRLRANQLDADAWAALLAERDEAKREVERLRATIKAYDAMFEDCDPPDIHIHWRSDRAQLAAATALLGQGLHFVPPTNGLRERWGADVRALLSSTSAPSERAAAERAVFKALDALGPNILLSYQYHTHWGPVVAAILALRAVSK